METIKNMLRFLVLTGIIWSLLVANVFAKEQKLPDGAKAAKARCNAVVKDLKDMWLYYDNFKISKIAYFVGSPVNSYWCTITATHINSKDNIKDVRIEINQRSDSARFTYNVVPDDAFPLCHKQLLTDCVE